MNFILLFFRCFGKVYEPRKLKGPIIRFVSKGSKWDSKFYNTKGSISPWFLMQNKIFITYFHQKYMKLLWED